MYIILMKVIIVETLIRYVYTLQDRVDLSTKDTCLNDLA